MSPTTRIAAAALILCLARTNPPAHAQFARGTHAHHTHAHTHRPVHVHRHTHRVAPAHHHHVHAPGYSVVAAPAPPDAASTESVVAPDPKVVAASVESLAARRVGAEPVAPLERPEPATRPSSASSSPVVGSTPEAVQTLAADPYGFADILNRFRAMAGLAPVAYDPTLATWAASNNAAQAWRGLGHHVNPNCFQNCGWNYGDAWSVAQGWMASPGHRQNMLTPGAQSFGIAFGPGPYWTLNVR